MPEPISTHGAHPDAPSAFPDPIRPVFRLIEQHRQSEVGLTLTHFVAAFVHPDFVCGLADFTHLSAEVKEAAVQFFEYCLTEGLTLEEQGAILRWITPFLTRQGKLPSSH